MQAKPAGIIQPWAPPPRSKPTALPPGPPPPACGNGANRAVQRAHAQELNTTANDLLYVGGDNSAGKRVKNCQEVQVMYLNGSYFISANTAEDTAALASLGRQGEIGVASCVKYAVAGTPGPFILKGAGTAHSEVHAEQNLLRIVTEMLKEGKEIKGTIEVWGTKPPCNICARALSFYADALYKNYSIHLLFEGRDYSNLLKEDRIDEAVAREQTTLARHADKQLSLAAPRKHVKTEETTPDAPSSSTHPTYSRFHADYIRYQKPPDRSSGEEEKKAYVPVSHASSSQASSSTQFRSQIRPRSRSRSPQHGRQTMTSSSGQSSTSESLSSAKSTAQQHKVQCKHIAMLFVLLMALFIGASYWPTAQTGPTKP